MIQNILVLVLAENQYWQDTNRIDCKKNNVPIMHVSALLNLRYLRLLSTLLKCNQLIEKFWNDFS